MSMIWKILIMNMETTTHRKYYSCKTFTHAFVGLAFSVAVFSCISFPAFAFTQICPSPGLCTINPPDAPAVSVSAQVGPTAVIITNSGNSIESIEYVNYPTKEDIKKYEEAKKEILNTADYNKDSRVDIIDLSILLYYYGKYGPTIAKYDLNGDGFIGLEDISVMLYYWTFF
jgi:hypothetical protein